MPSFSDSTFRVNFYKIFKARYPRARRPVELNQYTSVTAGMIKSGQLVKSEQLAIPFIELIEQASGVKDLCARYPRFKGVLLSDVMQTLRYFVDDSRRYAEDRHVAQLPLTVVMMHNIGALQDYIQGGLNAGLKQAPGFSYRDIYHHLLNDSYDKFKAFIRSSGNAFERVDYSRHDDADIFLADLSDLDDLDDLGGEGAEVNVDMAAYLSGERVMPRMLNPDSLGAAEVAEDARKNHQQLSEQHQAALTGWSHCLQSAIAVTSDQNRQRPHLVSALFTAATAYRHNAAKLSGHVAHSALASKVADTLHRQQEAANSYMSVDRFAKLVSKSGGLFSAPSVAVASDSQARSEEPKRKRSCKPRLKLVMGSSRAP